MLKSLVKILNSNITFLEIHKDLGTEMDTSSDSVQMENSLCGSSSSSLVTFDSEVKAIKFKQYGVSAFVDKINLKDRKTKERQNQGLWRRKNPISLKMQSSGVSKHTTPISKGNINFMGSLGNIRLYSLVLIDCKLSILKHSYLIHYQKTS